MPQLFPPDQRAQLLLQLTNSLNNLTVPELRAIAGAWGWPLRGNMKSLIVEQVVERLADSEAMLAAFTTLPPLQREALGWLNGLLGKGDVATVLHTALRIGGGFSLTKEEASQAYASLSTRGLLIRNPYQGYGIPAIFGEWLPGAAANGLRHTDRLDAEPPIGAIKLNGHVEHLLSALQSDKPRLATARPVAAVPAAVRGTVATTLIQARTGLVSTETLTGWGYAAPEDLALARTLLDLLLNGGLLAINDHLLGGKRLEPNVKTLAAWREQSPAVHQQTLRGWWLSNWQRMGPNTPALELMWNELDMALEMVTAYSLRQMIQWVTRDQLEREVGYLRAWLAGLVQRMQPDTWYDFRQFCELVYHLQRDLLQWQQYYPTWHWYRDQAAQDPNKMTLETWLATYGALIAVWLDGPMRWLGFVQVATENEHVIAFQRPSVVAERGAGPLPADTVRFTGADTLTLRNSWQAGELRQVIRQIAMEAERGRDVTAYRLDAATFRDALRAGRSAEQISQAFTAAGFPLPAVTATQLATWQAQAGRHQIYDNLAVIEFGDDEILEEIRTTINLERVQVYPVSPRCLVILDPAAVQPLVDELRKKGYTPQVVS